MITANSQNKDGRAATPSVYVDVDLDVEAVRRDFPILATRVRGGKPLVYLDNAATSQKPRAVIDATQRYYTSENANVHRGLYSLSERATAAYEGAREKLCRFINAESPHEIVFTRGTTEAINLVAQAFARPTLRAGDEVLITHMEHHSNIVPWQIVCGQTGAALRVAPIDDRGQLELDAFRRMLNPRTRIVSVVHVSNALGTINPVRQITELAHAVGAAVLIDGAQATPHMPVDVRAIGCDFYALSGHKMFGPTGIGALYGQLSRLEAMPPYQGGGDMIKSVTFEKTIYADPPLRFEAGTPNIAGAVGLAAAIDYLNTLGLGRIAAYEAGLLDYATRALLAVPGLRIIGTADHKAAVLSFALDDIHPHDIGTILDTQGIAIRTGHHCTQPVMDRFNVPATARASLAFYNTTAEVDALVQGLHKVREVFA